MARQQRAGGQDRLSALPDSTLTRILSHLRTDQAVRTSTLSRRWRRVFAAVPVVDIGAAPQRSCPAGVNQMVSGALLTRDSTAPIRTFRVDGFRGDRPSDAAIDQWIVTAMFAGAETLDIDLSRVDQKPICPDASTYYQSTPAEFVGRNFYAMPCRLFSHAANLRHVRLGNCALGLPEPEQSPLSLDTLETLSLKRINTPDHALQRLISACPRLTELTIEECPTVDRISVALPLLRAFTMRCCHNASHLLVDAPSLQCLGYKGTVAGLSSLSSLPTSTWGQIDTLAVDICAGLQANDTEKNRRLRRFVEGCTNLTTLRLSPHEKPPFFPYRVPRTLSGLAQLELGGPFHIDALVAILENTTNLTVLTLVLDDDNEASACRMAPPKKLLYSPVECLCRSLRRIHLVTYNGQDAHRQLAMFLLCEALCAEELQVTFAGSVGQGSATETRLMREMVSWPRNQRTRIVFRHEL